MARCSVGRTVPPVRAHALMSRLLRGEVANVRYADAVMLLRTRGFELRRVSGSHHVFAHPSLPELINVQNVQGQAKTYQLRQIVDMARRTRTSPTLLPARRSGRLPSRHSQRFCAPKRRGSLPPDSGKLIPPPRYRAMPRAG